MKKRWRDKKNIYWMFLLGLMLIFIIMLIKGAFLTGNAGLEQSAAIISNDCYICKDAAGNTLAYSSDEKCPKNSSAVKAISSADKSECINAILNINGPSTYQQTQESEVDLVKKYGAIVLDINKNGKLDPEDSFTMPPLPLSASAKKLYLESPASFTPSRVVKINGHDLGLTEAVSVEYNKDALSIRSDLDMELHQGVRYDRDLTWLRNGDIIVMNLNEEGKLVSKDLVTNHNLGSPTYHGIKINKGDRIILAKESTKDLLGVPINTIEKSAIKQLYQELENSIDTIISYIFLGR
ncbi:MAG: hypothetical protein KKE23_02455 [Nanoarchaeota archaeon]|nr:hypothetical protein [Nanoarchaeota archaeon]